MRRRRIADSIRNIDGRRAGIDRRLDHTAQEIRLRTGSILWRKFDVLAIALGSLHTVNGSLNDFLLPHPQLELAVNRTRSEENMNACIRRAFECLPSAI